MEMKRLVHANLVSKDVPIVQQAQTASNASIPHISWTTQALYAIFAVPNV